MKHALLYLIVFHIFLFTACRNTDVQEAGQQTQASSAAIAAIDSNSVPLPLVSGWLAPVQLTGVETSVSMEDYFSDVTKIDSITTSQGIRAQLGPDKKELILNIDGDLGFLSTLRFWAGGNHYDLLLKTPVTMPVTLRLRDLKYKSVRIKGEMNAWNPNEGVMVLKNGIWELGFQLNPGDYQYVFVVDGKEITDPKNPQKASNGSGGYNSLLSLKKAGKSGLPKLHSPRATGDVLQIGIDNPGAAFVFWENQLLETRKEGNIITVTLPREAATATSSSVRAFGQNENGVSNELLIPLEAGKVATEKTNKN
ncbi:MAG: hypothetical protein IPJ00_08460 [Saprospirales bacterium]|nr:hypothetical protein [Saprospirales bacterium]